MNRAEASHDAQIKARQESGAKEVAKAKEYAEKHHHTEGKEDVAEGKEA
jgi:hypothetical protein